MDWFLTNWVPLFEGLLLILVAFKMKNWLPYVRFAKSIGDSYIEYEEIQKDGKVTDPEKISFANKILLMINSGKDAFKGKPKK